MSKADQILRQVGGNLAESIGVRNGPSLRSLPRPEEAVPTASAKDGFSRLRAAGEMLLENIVPDPSQPRKEFDPAAIDRLAESIKAKGILQPLRVRWDPALGKHVILVGERRYRAALEAGLTSVPCIFVEAGGLTEAEILEEQLAENLLREDLNPIEEAHSFKRYMDLVGCHAKDLAQLLKVNPSTVTRALSLLKLPDTVQERLAVGEIPAKTGHELAKLRGEAAQTAMAERVVAERLTAEDATKAVRQRRGRAVGKGRGVTETFRTSGGIKVTVSAPRKITPQDIMAALNEALEQAAERREVA
jgi:ParB family chromosome partitioning protein